MTRARRTTAARSTARTARRTVTFAAALTIALSLASCGVADPEPAGIDDTTGTPTDVAVTEQPTGPPASSLEVTGETQRSEVEIRAGQILTELEAAPAPQGTVVEIPDTVLFDFDSADLKPEASAILDDVAEVLRLLPDAPGQVRGHTDDVGGEDYNLRLSADRAEAVRTYLVDAGVGADRLQSDGVGFAEPVASNDTDEGRAQNRRVEIILPTVDLDDLRE